MRALLLSLLIGCGPKLGPPDVTYKASAPMPLVQTSRDTGRWYVIVDTKSHGERLFFLDSGYARTTCDDDYVDELGLDTAGLVFVRGIGGTLVASKAKLPTLHAGGHEIRNFACIVRDLNQTSSIKDPLEVEVAGVIGADLLSRFVTEIDTERGDVRLIEPSRTEPLTGDGVIALRRAGKAGTRFLVDAAIDGTTGRWLLDTGARGSHVDGDDYGLEPTSIREDAWIGGTGGSGGRHEDLAFFDGSTVVFADHAVDDLRLVHRDHGLFGFDLLGLNVLSHYRITLDPGRRAARFVPITPAQLRQWRELNDPKVNRKR